MAEERKDAFFLDPDEAISLGDVEYMRKAVKTKRTFPKAKGGGELIQEVSATNVTEVEAQPKKETSSTPVSSIPKAREITTSTEVSPSGDLDQAKSFSPTGFSPAFPKMQFTSKTDRQKNDSNLSQFRKMNLCDTVKQSSERQRNDDNLDKFRKMARKTIR